MSATAPARTVAASATAMAPAEPVSGTWKTVRRPTDTSASSATVMSAEPMRPGAPSAVLPETRTFACSTTSARSSPSMTSAVRTTRARLFAPGTASSTSTVVSASGRTKARSGGRPSFGLASTAVTRRLPVISESVPVSRAVIATTVTPGSFAFTSMVPAPALTAAAAVPDCTLASTRAYEPEPPTMRDSGRTVVGVFTWAVAAMGASSAFALLRTCTRSSRSVFSPRESATVIRTTTSLSDAFGSVWRSARRPSAVTSARTGSSTFTGTADSSIMGSPSGSTQPSRIGITSVPPGASSGLGHSRWQPCTGHHCGPVLTSGSTTVRVTLAGSESSTPSVMR